MPKGRKTLSPRSKQFSERIISRSQNRFEAGMFRQEDTEGIDVPSNGMADLKNCYGFKNYAEGRGGSFLLTPANIGVTLTDNTESLSTAVQSGEIFAANGNTIPSVGDILMVYDDSDTTGDDFETAKGDPVRKYDSFRFTNIGVGTEAITYLGNLKDPADVGYGDTAATEYTASQSGTTVTATVGADFIGDHVGFYFRFGDGSRVVIKRIISTTQVEVNVSQTKSSQTKCIIQGAINATLMHSGLNKFIRQYGRRIYISRGTRFAGWTEIPGIGKVKPSNSTTSKIHQLDNDALLVASNGVFFIRLDKHRPYYDQINTPIPTVRITDVDQDAEKEHKYNYTYTLARITGNSFYKDRFNTDDDMFIEHETPPVEVDRDRKDFGTVWTDKPIGDESVTRGLLTGATLVTPYDEHNGYKTIADGQFQIDVSDTTYSIVIDFTEVKNMTEIAERIEDAMREYSALGDVKVKFDEDHFEIRTGDNDTIAAATAGLGGTDMSGNLKFSTGTATTEVTTQDQIIETLTLPADSERITHYPVYRTADIIEEDVNSHLYAWAADVPVCKPIIASIDVSGNITVTAGTIETEDIGNILVGEDGTQVYISTTSVVLDSDQSAYSEGVIASQSWGIGGGSVFTANIVGTAISIDSGYTLTANDVGRLIFWSDGTHSLIKSVTNSTTAVAAWGNAIPSTAAHIKPVSRKFNDTLSDENFTARVSAYPLENRFQIPIPNGSVSVITPGFLLVAVRGNNSYYYFETGIKRLMGYYNAAFQFNDKITDGIQSMKSREAIVTIRGAFNTYLVDTSTPVEVGETSVGESVLQISDPQIVTRGIGSVGDGGSVETERGSELLVTNEPAVRLFDGRQYGDNLSLDRVQKSDIQKMKQVFISGYSSNSGAFFWGKQEE